MIHLSIGDPTTYGNLKAPKVFVEEVAACARDYKLHGYQHSAGMLKAREAIAKRYSYASSELTPNDVIIASGCSGALDIAIKALAGPGDNILGEFFYFDSMVVSHCVLLSSPTLLWAVQVDDEILWD